MTLPVIRAECLTKRFADLVAVDGVTFEVQPGELFGFLGPNGAGKTTTTCAGAAWGDGLGFATGLGAYLALGGALATAAVAVTPRMVWSAEETAGRRRRRSPRARQTGRREQRDPRVGLGSSGDGHRLQGARRGPAQPHGVGPGSLRCNHGVRDVPVPPFSSAGGTPIPMGPGLLAVTALLAELLVVLLCVAAASWGSAAVAVWAGATDPLFEAADPRVRAGTAASMANFLFHAAYMFPVAGSLSLEFHLTARAGFAVGALAAVLLAGLVSSIAHRLGMSGAANAQARWEDATTGARAGGGAR